MMTVHAISGGDAGGYARYLLNSEPAEREQASSSLLTHGDYYLRDSREVSAWWGGGAAKLGLKGTVQRQDLLRVWRGMNPESGAELVRRGANGEHTVGVDCTFSAMKSVSVVWALAEDEAQRAEIEASVTRATEAALAHIERSAALVRRRIDGDVRHQEAAGLVVARFRHHTARVTEDQAARGLGPDPQLHDHCVIANLALRKEGQEARNGEWGAIDSRTLLLIQKEAGALFRVQLRREIEALGYLTERAGDHWEISGVRPELIEEFSMRERAVVGAFRRFAYEHGRPPREDERRNLVVWTRGSKGENPLGDRPQWAQRAQERGHDPAAIQPEAPNPDRPAVGIPSIVKRVIGELTQLDSPITEESAIFDDRQLRQSVAVALQGETRALANAEAFDAVLAAVKCAPDLVQINAVYWTTRDQLRSEEFVRDAMVRRGRERRYALPHSTVDNALATARVALDKEQTAAVRALSDGRGAALLIAEAGTGKGEVSRVVASAHKAMGWRVTALAAAGETAQRFGKEVGAHDARTIDSLAARIQHGGRLLGTRDLLIVDEAGIMETARWTKLLRAAGQAKIVAVGDPRQFSSIEAGGLLPVLRHAIGASHLEEVYRVRDESWRWTVNEWRVVRQGRGREALKEYDARGLIHVSETRAQAREAMVDNWNRDRLEGKRDGRPISDYLLTTDATNREVDRLNEMAQARLRESGHLGEKSVEVRIVDAENEYQRTETIHEGDSVRFTRHVVLENDRRVENGEWGTVLAINDSRVVVGTETRRVVLLGDDRASLRLGYAQHLYPAQGRTVRTEHAQIGGRTTSQESTYVLLTRPQQGCTLYLDYDSLGVPKDREVQGDVRRELIPEAERRRMALEVVGNKIETSRPQVAALTVTSEPTVAGAEAAPPRSPAFSPGLATERQRDYIQALGGKLRDQASWVEASLTIDRLRNQSEGAWAKDILVRKHDAEVAERAIARAGSNRAAAAAWEEQGYVVEDAAPAAAGVDAAREQAEAQQRGMAQRVAERQNERM